MRQLPYSCAGLQLDGPRKYWFPVAFDDVPNPGTRFLWPPAVRLPAGCAALNFTAASIPARGRVSPVANTLHIAGRAT